MKSKLWSRNVIQKLVFISLLIEHASVSKNKEDEDMQAAWASSCRALTYAAGDRSTSASTSRWRVRHWLGDQCWFAGPGLPVLSALVLHTRFWDACPESPVLGILSWFTYPEWPVLCHMSRVVEHGHAISLSWILYTSAASNPTVTVHMLNIAWRRHSWRAMYSTSMMKFVFLFLRTMKGFILLTQHVSWYMHSAQGIALQWSNNTV